MEVSPVIRVKRSRLAFAVSVTLAALPVLVLDNLPASAERNEPLAVSADALDGSAADATAGPSTTAAPGSTTEPPAQSEAATAATLTAPTAPPSTSPPPPAPPRPAAAVAVPAPAPAPPPPPTTAPPAPAAARTGQPGDPNDPASWDAMAMCESGGNWAINTGNGYYGGLQFSLATWQSYGGTGYPHEASKATQIAIGKKLQAERGWAAWPGCSRKLGYT